MTVYLMAIRWCSITSLWFSVCSIYLVNELTCGRSVLPHKQCFQATFRVGVLKTRTTEASSTTVRRASLVSLTQGLILRQSWTHPKTVKTVCCVYFAPVLLDLFVSISHLLISYSQHHGICSRYCTFIPIRHSVITTKYVQMNKQKIVLKNVFLCKQRMIIACCIKCNDCV